MAGGAAVALVHALGKLGSRDPVLAVGGSLTAAAAVGSGWWAAQMLLWLGSSAAEVYRGEAVFSGWLLAMVLAAALLLAAWLLPARWRGTAAGVLAVGALLVLAQHGLQAPVLEHRWGLAVQPLAVLTALALLPVGLGAWVVGRSEPDNEPSARRSAVAALLIAAGLAGLQLGAMVWLQPAETVALHAGPEWPVSAAYLWRLLVLPAALVAVGVLGALVDLRGRGRTRALAASLRMANHQLRQMAIRDPLTGLANRSLFDERMKLALEHVGRAPGGLAVLYVDLDGFKPINDSFGHAAGDAVLREVGGRLEGLVAEPECAARVGADEFLLLLETAGDAAAAASLARRTLQVLSQPYRLPQGTEVSLSCSIGIALFPQHGPVAKLVPNADAAMDAAKSIGGSTFAFFEPGMDLDTREQVELQRDLRLAVERGELQLYYQPKVDARTGTLTGAEALVRWEHPTRGTVMPHLLIPVAERFGLIGMLGAWVIDEACRQVQQWQRAGLRVRVAVNLSVQQLRQEDLVSRVHRALRDHQVAPELLSFEITESVAMEDTAATMRTFHELAQLGVLLAIDDFGTGHSSLAYLRKLPAKLLKIDRSFVADLEHSADALAVVDAVVSLAHALGLRVVAEGVETEGQRDLLLGLRCDELQGYLIARPMSASSLALWVMDDRSPEKIDFQGRLFSDTRPTALH